MAPGRDPKLEAAFVALFESHIACRAVPRIDDAYPVIAELRRECTMSLADAQASVRRGVRDTVAAFVVLYEGVCEYGAHQDLAFEDMEAFVRERRAIRGSVERAVGVLLGA